MTDIEIAQNVDIKRIKDVAKKIGLNEEDLYLYGNYKAKILKNIKPKKDAKLILVTAINPTPAGEGKTTTTIGLNDALCLLNKKSIVALREPSFGPVLGLKGGATGGGYAQVIPMEDINLFFTGDFPAITCANNTVAAVIDNSLHQGNLLNIDPRRITWHRCMDMNDRALRNITIGLGGHTNGIPREDHVDISVASEIMAILCLSKDMDDFKRRIDRTIVAYTYDRLPITIKDLGITGAIAMIMKDALKPNLVQTLEGNPAIIHGGPFANIAHGCNSVIATNMALGLADIVVTEAGFGADLGMEKFLDIKCPIINKTPDCVVLVATIRALKMHGGVLKENLDEENLEALKLGLQNLDRHIENIKKYNLNFIVAINKFSSDTLAETNYLLDYAKEKGYPISLSDVWAKGGKGALDLAQKVLPLLDNKKEFQPLYDNTLTIKQKISKICKEIYRAENINYTEEALQQINKIKRDGYENLPICIAKTQYSFSQNPKLLNAPLNFDVTIKNVILNSGAGFIVCILGDIMRMPGLPKSPAALNMDVVDDKIKGLF
jgi:formate--tetrahydrofolate ligase